MHSAGVDFVGKENASHVAKAASREASLVQRWANPAADSRPPVGHRIREMVARLQKLGVPLKDILGAQVRAKSTKAATHYRHPDNTELHWSGRGRKPGWVKQWIEAGQPLDALRN